MTLETQISTLLIDDDGSQENIIYPKTGEYIGIPDILEKDKRDIDIPANTTDLAIGLGQVNNLRFLIILVKDASITIKLNSNTNYAIPITVYRLNSTDGYRGILQLSTNGISEIYVTNAGAVTAKMKILMVS